MTPSPIHDYLQSLLQRFRGLRDGQVADYIPELQRADPEWFGICVATHDGYVYEVGDSQQPFTIQSISKPLTYGLALEHQGQAAVVAKVGVEPSGEAFNAISLRPGSGTPFNPLINAGAIATCGLVRGDTTEEKTAQILDTLSRYAGRPLDVDEAVYRSESQTGHRNRAIGWMLHNFAVLEHDPTATLESYFRQCAIRVTCRDLALMGATLTNGGVHPLTGVRAVPRQYVDNILSVMATCGMYDASGEWLYRTGLPAKSGVGGGILAVLPGQLAIAVFSPRLDAQGNSARGIAVCEALVADLALHLFDARQQATPTIRLETTGARVASRQRREAAASDDLKRQGSRLRLLQLQGALTFATVEPVVRNLMAHTDETDCCILNLRLVLGITPPAARLLVQARAALRQQNKDVVFSEPQAWQAVLLEAGVPPQAFFDDDDFALEYGENRLLAEGPVPAASATRVALADCALFRGLAAHELALLEPLLEHHHYAAGQTVLSVGQATDELFVIVAGAAMVSVSTPQGIKRLDACTAGMSFGELAFLDHSPRSAQVTALGALECRTLTRQAFAELEALAPTVKIRLLENIATGLTHMLRQKGRELTARSA